MLAKGTFITTDRILGLTTALTKLLGPVLEFLKTLLANRRSDIDQTRFEVFEPYRSDVVHRHGKQSFSQAAERTHSCVFGQGSDV